MLPVLSKLRTTDGWPRFSAFLFFIQPRIDQLEGIRNHTPAQLAAYTAFINAYGSCLDDVDTIHRLTQSNALKLLDTFEAYFKSLQLDEGIEDWFTLEKAKIYTYIVSEFR